MPKHDIVAVHNSFIQPFLRTLFNLVLIDESLIKLAKHISEMNTQGVDDVQLPVQRNPVSSDYVWA